MVSKEKLNNEYSLKDIIMYTTGAKTRATLIPNAYGDVSYQLMWM